MPPPLSQVVEHARDARCALVRTVAPVYAAGGRGEVTGTSGCSLANLRLARWLPSENEWPSTAPLSHPLHEADNAAVGVG